jgi:hypothetical protein
MLMLSQACSKEADLKSSLPGSGGPAFSSKSVDQVSTVEHEGMVILGEQLENPYTVSNMQAAYDHIADADPQYDIGLDIEASHQYIKFAPQDSLQLQSFEEFNENWEIYTYPLDYEIQEGGIYYHDPSIPDNKPTYQYVVVKMGETLPAEIPVAETTDLYIPELDPSFTEEDSSFVMALVNQALLQTGNYEGPDNKKGKVSGLFGFWSPPKWRPSGTITVHDDVQGGQIPLEGVRVRARRWFITKSDLTDANGYFETGRYRRPANYSIIWKRPDYAIRKGFWPFAAIYNGPKQKADWDLDIADNLQSTHLAHIHRAAFRYFYGNTGGLKRPGYASSLKILSKNGSSSIGLGVFHGPVSGTPVFNAVYPGIRLWTERDDGTFMRTDLLYSVTAHEIGHASHLKLMGGGVQLWQVCKLLRESWAEFIQWHLTSLEYSQLDPDYGDPNINCDSRPRPLLHKQFYDVNSGSPAYSPIYIDMADNFNQARETCVLNRTNLPANPCPNGGIFDGSNCALGNAPNGTNAFIYQNNFYHTPEPGNVCNQFPGATFDGANCFVSAIPNGSLGFIYQNGFYLHPEGDNNFPYDVITGYTANHLETNIVADAYCQSSLVQELKAHKQGNANNRMIDFYFNFNF